MMTLLPRVTAFIALAIAVVLPSAAMAQNGPGDGGIFTTTLNNGLRVVVVEDQRRSGRPDGASGTALDRCEETPGRPVSRTRSST